MAHEMTAAHAEHPTATGLDNRKLMMWLFLGSECLFFGSLIATYFLYRGRSLVGPFSEDVYDIPFTSVSSFVLLMSSLTMVLALHAIQRNDLYGMRTWLIGTAVLGLVFLGGQVYEFTVFYNEGLALEQNLFGSTFFVLTGFHGAHVGIGVLILSSIVAWSFWNPMTSDDALNVELAGLYWHFVDVVWIVIFTLIYLLPE